MAEFRVALREGVHAALRYLNCRTPHRLTGVYRYDGDMLRNMALFNRSEPDKLRGDDIPMANAYCTNVGLNREPLEFDDAKGDRRFTYLPGSSVVCYSGVLIASPAGVPYGTLCHYDTRRCETRTSDIPLLNAALRPSRGFVRGWPMSRGLAALIHPHLVSELADHYTRNEPFVVHGLRDSTASLRAVPLVESLDVLLGIWPEMVQAHLPDVADESNAVSVSPHDARKLFANGMGLLFDDVHRYAPELVPWLDAIRADVGLSALTQQRCLIYATPATKGTAWHFDQNVNFVLQVHGTKRWWLAANEHVSRPMTRHRIGQRMDPELESYAQTPMLTEAPANAREIVLEPGSLLFVPRGVWHSTLATTDALALNFTFSPPTWIDVFTAALRGKLALSHAWRQTAAPMAADTFDALLRELAEEAPHWNATDILAATEP